MDQIFFDYVFQHADLIKLLSTCAGSIVALSAVFVAFGQLNTAKRKLKLDLYDKRLEIFHIVDKSSSFSILGQSLTQEEKLLFWRAAQDSKWLFNKKISKELETLYIKTEKIYRMQEHRNFLFEEFRLKKDESSQLRLSKMDEMLTKENTELADLQAKLKLRMSPFISPLSLAKQ
jgi:hypothetical protein